MNGRSKIYKDRDKKMRFLKCERCSTQFYTSTKNGNEVLYFEENGCPECWTPDDEIPPPGIQVTISSKPMISWILSKEDIDCLARASEIAKEYGLFITTIKHPDLPWRDARFQKGPSINEVELRNALSKAKEAKALLVIPSTDQILYSDGQSHLGYRGKFKFKDVRDNV